MKLGFIGTGNLASAIIKGVVSSGKFKPDEIKIYDINSEKASKLADLYGVGTASAALEIAAECENIVIAVKPKDFSALAASITKEAKKKNPLIISTAAGTEIKSIESSLGYDARIARIMPNINAAAGEAMTAVCLSAQAGESDAAFALDFCSCFGKAILLEEKYFSAFTAVSGSAPAFAFMFADALTTAAIKYGIPADTAQQTAAQMLMGSAKLMLESPLAVSDLIRSVCSPAGTTVEGVCSLKETGFESSIISAIDKTVEKDRLMSANK